MHGQLNLKEKKKFSDVFRMRSQKSETQVGMGEVEKWKSVSQTNVSATERLTEPWWEAREMLYESLLALFKI